MRQEIISSIRSSNASVNPHVPGLVEASRLTEAPDHQDLGGAGVVEPLLPGPQEHVGLLAPASCGLTGEQ